MPRQFAITIGINAYRYYPRPLKYAENDAVAMEAYLREIGFAEVLRYSDNSPSFGQDSTHPERTNLLRAITRLSTQLRLKPEDSFWFFFSGHGARQSGQDYLLPSDGDPDNLVDTAIPIDRVMRSLTQCGAGNLVLILDACRNEVPELSKDIGNQTVELAKQSGIVTLFSCSPGERSYELPEQNQGAFTYALLNALQGDYPPERTNAQQLSQYLRQHVSGLAKNWGKQTPYVIAEPIEKGTSPLLPSIPIIDLLPSKPNFEQLMLSAYQAFINKDFEKAKEISRIIIRDSPNADQRTSAVDLLSQIIGENVQPVLPFESEKGVNYTKLRELLEAQDWKTADYETSLRMLEVVRRREGDIIRSEELITFPCTDLQTINNLWMKYSENRFGLALQKRVYLESGGNLDGKYPGDESWKEFGRRVGWMIDNEWLNYEKLAFHPDAPPGHLPALLYWGRGGRIWRKLFFRIDTCHF